MNRFTITILFALCISQYANSAVVSNTLNDVKILKKEFGTVLKEADLYLWNYIMYDFIGVQGKAKNDFQAQFNKELKAVSTEITAAVQKKGNSLKANKCVKEANVQLDSLKVSASKNVENCLERHKRVGEMVNIVSELLDEFSAANRIGSLIKSLEKDVEASNGRNANVESKLPGVRSSVDVLKNAHNELIVKADQILVNLESQFKVCNQKHLADGHSNVEEIKQEASQCISKA